jgi:hypothetical protein
MDWDFDTLFSGPERSAGASSSSTFRLSMPRKHNASAKEMHISYSSIRRSQRKT